MKPSNLNLKLLSSILMALTGLLLVFLLLPAILDDSGNRSGPGGTLTLLTEAEVTVDGETSVLQLPGSIPCKTPRTQVTLTFRAPADTDSFLYFRSIYAPLEVRLAEPGAHRDAGGSDSQDAAGVARAQDSALRETKGKLLYSWGSPDSYPAFFLDPPSMAKSIRMKTGGGAADLVFVYESPVSRSSLSLYAPVLGSEQEILAWLWKTKGTAFTLSIILLLVGSLLLLFSLFFLAQGGNGILLRLPGLLALTAGLWTFSENTLSLYLTQLPSVLYLCSFLGLFSLPLPILEYSAALGGLKRYRLMTAVRVLMYGLFGAAILLQFTGLFQFSQILYGYHLAILSSLLVCGGCLLHSWLKNGNQYARLLFCGQTVLTLFAITELLNYYLRITWQLSAIFQIGILIYIVLAVFFTGLAARGAQLQLEETAALKAELQILEQAVEAQKRRNDQLLIHAEEIRRIRHDTRHHLSAIKGLVQANDTAGLSSYLDELQATVPSDKETRYCRNGPVNAIINHYASMAEKAGIELSLLADVPPGNPNISDALLCVVFGNLLENGIEACSRMTSGKRWIRFRTLVKNGTLFITMDNSFSGSVTRDGHRFISSKTHRPGVGLASVRSVAEAHGGEAVFTPREDCFRSEVYLKL